MPRFRVRTYLFVFLAVALFSPVFLISKFLIPPLNAFTYMFLRSAFGSAFICVVLLSRKLFGSFFTLLKQSWKDVLIFSIICHLIPLILVFVSTPITTPTDQVIINNMNLTFVVIINRFLFRVKTSRYLAIAVAINFAGALLVLWPLDFSQNPNLFGNIIMIAGVFVGSFFPIWNKKLATRADPAVVNFTITFIPTLVLLPVVFFGDNAKTINDLSNLGWLYIAFIGIGISGIAYFCLNQGYLDPAMTPEHMSMFQTLIPVFGIALSVIAGFGTGWVNYVGAGLVIFSIVFSNLTKSPKSVVPLIVDGEGPGEK